MVGQIANNDDIVLCRDRDPALHNTLDKRISVRAAVWCDIVVNGVADWIASL